MAVVEKEVADPLTDPVIDPVDRLLFAVGLATLAPSEIQQRLGLRHRPTFRENYLRPALRLKVLERTLPDKPGSRLQKVPAD
jgi:ATP-dependent DNA helicase RecG